jgi:peptidoglycan biosynthesis protein MviN/MurJ (putative lipid II flippase)
VGAAVTQNLMLLPLGLSIGEFTRLLWLRSAWHHLAEESVAVNATVAVGDGTGGVRLGAFQRSATAQIAAQGVLAATPLIERLVAGAMFVAAISRLEYAYRLLMVSAVLFDGGIAPWLLARWSRLRSAGRFDARWKEVHGELFTAAAISAAVGAAIGLLAPAIVKVVLLHGAFTADDAAAVTMLIRWYAIGFVANMTVLCAERALLATARNRRFLELGMVRAVSRIALVATLAGTLGIVTFPIAYASSEMLYLTLVLTSIWYTQPAVASG